MTGAETERTEGLQWLFAVKVWLEMVEVLIQQGLFPYLQ